MAHGESKASGASFCFAVGRGFFSFTSYFFFALPSFGRPWHFARLALALPRSCSLANAGTAGRRDQSMREEASPPRSRHPPQRHPPSQAPLRCPRYTRPITQRPQRRFSSPQTVETPSSTTPATTQPLRTLNQKSTLPTLTTAEAPCRSHRHRNRKRSGASQSQE